MADMELDCLLCAGDTWWDGYEDDGYGSGWYSTPKRRPSPGWAAPTLVPADPMDFPLVTP